MHSLRFRLEKARYEDLVARIEAADPAEREKVAGHACDLDIGPPLRIAFHLPGGILDNFTAIVYDPTGEVMKVNQFGGDLTRSNDLGLVRIQMLFGGTLIWAEPLGGPWYRCGFT